MKATFLSSVFLLLMFGSVHARKLSVGVKAGADLNKITGKSFDEEYKAGYHIGAFAEVKVNKIGIQPEIYFSQVNAEKGSDGQSFFNANRISKAKMSYLNIPVLVNVYFNKNVALQLGPQFGALINKSISGTGNVNNTFKNGDFSLLGGLQVKISRFRIIGRYIVGLNDINDVTNSNLYSDGKWKSQTIHLGLGYAIL